MKTLLNRYLTVGAGFAAIILFIMSFFIPAAFVYAHATGQSLIKNTGDYTIDINYDSITINPRAGEATAFDFLLFNTADDSQADYNSVTVDIIRQGGATVFYADIISRPNVPTGMVYVFPQGGNYILKAYYKKKEATLAQAEFPILVSQTEYDQPSEIPQKRQANFLNVAICGALILGVAIVFLHYRIKRKQ
jgi:hypothetical protein